MLLTPFGGVLSFLSIQLINYTLIKENVTYKIAPCFITESYCLFVWISDEHK